MMLDAPEWSCLEYADTRFVELLLLNPSTPPPIVALTLFTGNEKSGGGGGTDVLGVEVCPFLPVVSSWDTRGPQLHALTYFGGGIKILASPPNILVTSSNNNC